MLHNMTKQSQHPFYSHAAKAMRALFESQPKVRLGDCTPSDVVLVEWPTGLLDSEACHSIHVIGTVNKRGVNLTTTTPNINDTQTYLGTHDMQAVVLGKSPLSGKLVE